MYINPYCNNCTRQYSGDCSGCKHQPMQDKFLPIKTTKTGDTQKENWGAFYENNPLVTWGLDEKGNEYPD